MYHGERFTPMIPVDKRFDGQFMRYYDALKNVTGFASKHERRERPLTLEEIILLYCSEMEQLVKCTLSTMRGWQVNDYIPRAFSKTNNYTTKADGMCKLDCDSKFAGEKTVDPNREYILEIKTCTKKTLYDWPTEDHLRQVRWHLSVYSDCGMSHDVILVYYNSERMEAWLIADLLEERNARFRDTDWHPGRRNSSDFVIKIVTYILKSKEIMVQRTNE